MVHTLHGYLPSDNQTPEPLAIHRSLTGVRVQETDSERHRETERLERRGTCPPCPAHFPAGPWQTQPLRPPSRGLAVRAGQSPPPTAPPGTGSSSQPPLLLAGGSPGMLPGEASLLCSLGRPPGLGARRVVRPAVQSNPCHPQAGLPGGRLGAQPASLVPVWPGRPCKLTACPERPSCPGSPLSWRSWWGLQACFSKTTATHRTGSSQNRQQTAAWGLPLPPCPLRAGPAHDLSDGKLGGGGHRGPWEAGGEWRLWAHYCLGPSASLEVAAGGVSRPGSNPHGPQLPQSTILLARGPGSQGTSGRPTATARGIF